MANQFLDTQTDKLIVAVGLGPCRTLYSCKFYSTGRCLLFYSFLYLQACLYTEWWDLDEPCKKGEVESVYMNAINDVFKGIQVNVI